MEPVEKVSAFMGVGLLSRGKFHPRQIHSLNTVPRAAAFFRRTGVLQYLAVPAA
jgi:hypothetical protein